LRFLVEKTRSRTGLHRRTKRLFVVRKSGEVVEVWGGDQARGTYAKGEARLASPPPVGSGDALVYIDFVMNPRKRVKGKVYVYDSRYSLVLVMNYRKLKLRRSWGSKSYFWAVKALFDKLGVPVKRVNLLTGEEASPAGMTGNQRSD